MTMFICVFKNTKMRALRKKRHNCVLKRVEIKSQQLGIRSGTGIKKLKTLWLTMTEGAGVYWIGGVIVQKRIKG